LLSLYLNDTTKFINYINEKNSARRIQKRLQIINQNKVLLEIYENKNMHPSKIHEHFNKYIDNDNDKSVDEIIENYLQFL
jgi:adenylate kinase family enzyme